MEITPGLFVRKQPRSRERQIKAFETSNLAVGSPQMDPNLTLKVDRLLKDFKKTNQDENKSPNVEIQVRK